MEAKGSKKHFNIDENISNKQIYALLDNADSDEEEIENFRNNSDRKFITEFIAEFILPTNNTLDNSLTTLEANIQVVRENEE